MKILKLTALLLLLQGCSTHPSNVEPITTEFNYGFKSCEQNYQDVHITYDKYINLYDKQEFASFGDIFWVFMVGLPLMPDHEEELGEALNDYNVTLSSYEKNCKS
ncbi:hypothetical protein VP14_025 [Vibrio phage VPMCC14]|nr:hypothetical protein VP14_025 [Vibrio phage VPMCC14]